MPLTKKGKKIKRAMAEEYGPERGEDGRIARVGGRMVERDDEGRPVRIH